MSFLTLTSIAQKLDTTSQSVRRWICRGIRLRGRVEYLAGVQIGRNWRVDEKELARFLHAVQTTPRARHALTGTAGAHAGDQHAMLNALRRAGRPRPIILHAHD